ncbi:hypothetical protein J437_LFUL010729 [Ladona fulva]|uniref:Glycosyl transferase CAP10 domain-containing protein n=1 Tax=Ladona fulva TaxID=123851 RepID=A0A8K0KCT3_LADFU|nr:hypothetical protein J437_LFUL010729 [Ladona fulva]
MAVISNKMWNVLVVLLISSYGSCLDVCEEKDVTSCVSRGVSFIESHISKENNPSNEQFLLNIETARSSYQPKDIKNCSIYKNVYRSDLAPFKGGIAKNTIQSVYDRGTKYQIINHKLYREKECMYPARCSGVEHFILKVIKKIPNLELVLNTRDWPQVSKHYSEPKPVFSFSKTDGYYDIMYPAWSFWDGGPAISLYPKGLGRWDLHRKQIAREADLWPWERKKSVAFFRGSRTSSERDPLILLSRERPDLVDAQYTKNQAWKSDEDTLYVPAATEVPLESHCHYKYLFNFRGVAASFRFKHLFLCRSLVFHVGDEWMEFFYYPMLPWIHYIPVRSTATKEEIRSLIEFAKNNDEIAQKIAQEGYDFIWNHLRMKDIQCYWRSLLKNYAKLIKYDIVRDPKLQEITNV